MLVSASAVFVAAMASYAVAQISTCTRTYIVHPGDSCDSISAAQNVSTYQLAINNKQVDAACDNLQAYEVLCLGKPGSDCSATYVVQSGDGCWAIANAAQITIDVLEANNPNVGADCTIYPGEVLCVSGQDFNYTSA